ncbi:MAG: hypothetical protein AAFR33_10060 [Pseudomonadota bacterium]
MGWIVRTGLMALLGLGVAGCVVADFSSDDPGFTEAPGAFEGRFLAVSDADMAGTAYADGQLEPFEGALDTMILFDDGAAIATAPAPNSVISWPQIVDVHPSRPTAYVIETRGAALAGLQAMESVYSEFPVGTALNIFDTSGADLDRTLELDGLLENPQSVEVSADGRFLLIAQDTDGAEIAILPLDAEGLPERGEDGAPLIRTLALNPPYRKGDSERRLRVAHLSSDCQTLAVNVANVRVQFYRLALDGDGLPERVAALGEPIDVGVRLAVGRWTPDGQYFLITDVNSYESSLAMLTQRGGQVHVIAPPKGASAARLVDSARVGRFAEGLEISDDGTRIASIAMGRTYLPELPFLEVWPKRRTYSLHLLSLDLETGELGILDEIRAAGVLPEDVIFDETGRNLAVATFHRRKGADRQRGFIDFFSITGEGEFIAQGKTQAVMRGPHDLVRLP